MRHAWPHTLRAAFCSVAAMLLVGMVVFFTFRILPGNAPALAFGLNPTPAAIRALDIGPEQARPCPTPDMAMADPARQLGYL